MMTKAIGAGVAVTLSLFGAIDHAGAKGGSPGFYLNRFSCPTPRPEAVHQGFVRCVGTKDRHSLFRKDCLTETLFLSGPFTRASSVARQTFDCCAGRLPLEATSLNRG
jgi:hypothetical protein